MVCRWSAAKGVSLITSRLPPEAADDVLDSILQVDSRDSCSVSSKCLRLQQFISQTFTAHGFMQPASSFTAVGPLLLAGDSMFP